MNTRLITSLAAISMLGASALTLAGPASSQEEFVARVLAPVAVHQSETAVDRSAVDALDVQALVVSRVLSSPVRHVEPSTVTAETQAVRSDAALNSYL